MSLHQTRSKFRRFSALTLLVISLNALNFVEVAHSAPLPPGFSEVRLQVIADNDFAVFMGDDANATRLFYDNIKPWPTQIQEAAVLDVVPVAGETFLYIVAMGGSASENWAGTINGKDIVTYPGAQVAINRTPIGSASVNGRYLLVNNYFQGWSTGGGSIVENGTYPVSLTNLQTALTGAVWGSAKMGETGVPNPITGGVCCGGYLPADGIRLTPDPGNPATPNKGFSGKGWEFPSTSAVVFRYPLSAAQLPVAPGNAQVIVDWNAPNGGEAPADYLVDYKETSEPDATYKPFSVISAPTTIETVTGLTNGTSYTFRVAGRNSSGVVGAASVSRSVTPTGPASQPTNLSYAALDNAVSIGFTSPENNGGYSISNYQYSIDNGTSWVSRSPESVTAPIVISSGLSNTVPVTIRIRAVTPYGTGTSSASIAVIPGIVSTRTLTYSSGTLDSISGLASGATYSSGETFTVASGPTRSNFRFTGWKSGPASFQSGDTYLVSDSNINLTAQWTQSSMYGLATADKQQVLKWNISGNESIDTTVSGGGGSSVRVVIPSLAFDAGTEIIFWRILNQNIAKSAISNDNDYIVNMALSWSTGDDVSTPKTVPISRSAIQMTITNNSITAGAKAWQIIDGVPTLLGTATQDGVIVVSFTHDPIVVAANFAVVVAPVVVAPVVVAPVVVAPIATTQPAVISPPPSSIKVIQRPKISRKDSFLTCSSGVYRFMRGGNSEESFTVTSQVVRLLSNGQIVDSSTSTSQFIEFTTSAAYENSTLSCEVIVTQESVISKQTSLDTDTIKLLEADRAKNIHQANNDYYSAREIAYKARVEGNPASTAIWKKALKNAVETRESQKIRASADLITSLEESGISILYITKTKEITPKPSIPVDEKASPVINVQPTNAMKRIGIIYFANGAYVINDASKLIIKSLVSEISTSMTSTLLSYGHTDSKGGTNNTLLSRNRARAVAKLLRSLLPGQKIVTGWYASSKPVATGNNKTDLAKNRRVEIYVK